MNPLQDRGVCFHQRMGHAGPTAILLQDIKDVQILEILQISLYFFLFSCMFEQETLVKNSIGSRKLIWCRFQGFVQVLECYLNTIGLSLLSMLQYPKIKNFKKHSFALFFPLLYHVDAKRLRRLFKVRFCGFFIVIPSPLNFWISVFFTAYWCGGLIFSGFHLFGTQTGLS